MYNKCGSVRVMWIRCLAVFLAATRCFPPNSLVWRIPERVSVVRTTDVGGKKAFVFKTKHEICIGYLGDVWSNLQRFKINGKDPCVVTRYGMTVGSRHILLACNQGEGDNGQYQVNSFDIAKPGDFTTNFIAPFSTIGIVDLHLNHLIVGAVNNKIYICNPNGIVKHSATLYDRVRSVYGTTLGVGKTCVLAVLDKGPFDELQLLQFDTGKSFPTITSFPSLQMGQRVLQTAMYGSKFFYVSYNAPHKNSMSATLLDLNEGTLPIKVSFVMENDDHPNRCLLDKSDAEYLLYVIGAFSCEISTYKNNYVYSTIRESTLIRFDRYLVPSVATINYTISESSNIFAFSMVGGSLFMFCGNRTDLYGVHKIEGIEWTLKELPAVGAL